MKIKRSLSLALLALSFCQMAYAAKFDACECDNHTYYGYDGGSAKVVELFGYAFTKKEDGSVEKTEQRIWDTDRRFFGPSCESVKRDYEAKGICPGPGTSEHKCN